MAKAATKEKKERRAWWIPKIRATFSELARIQGKAEEAGLSLSAYVRRSALECVIVVRDSVIDKTLIYQLTRIGNNLNQLTKQANIKERLSVSQIDLLERVLLKLETVLDGLLADGS